MFVCGVSGYRCEFIRVYRVSVNVSMVVSMLDHELVSVCGNVSVSVLVV